MTSLSINATSIAEARLRLAGHAWRTPILVNPILDMRLEGRVFIKAESLQRTGSFKFRGAMNRLLAMPPDERRCGVVAFSSGNHALAVAESAKLLSCVAVLLMPRDAPAIKIEGTRARGAEVVLYDRDLDDRDAIARELVRERGLTFIPPFDDPLIMAGQGTAAAEAIEQLAADHDLPDVDQAVICCGGGGLAAGWTVAIKAANPRARIFVVEPFGFDDTGRSLLSGNWERNPRISGTICDALQVVTPGKLTLPVLLDGGAVGVTVSDAEVIDAIRFAATELKLILEPGGAAPLAALLGRRIPTASRSTLIIASGGNTDARQLAAYLGQEG